MDSEGERLPSSMEEKKPQRKKQMKTPVQKEMLEEAYQAEKYPSEAAKAELARQLDITEKQLNMWFNHRRRKDRVLEVEEAASLERRAGFLHDRDHHHDPGIAGVSGGVDPSVPSGRHFGDAHFSSGRPSHYYSGGTQGFYDDEVNPSRTGIAKSAGRGRGHRRVTDAADDHKRKRRGGSSFGVADRQQVEAARALAQAAAIDEVKENFPEFRTDGPALVVEFDHLPAGAFSRPSEARKQKGLDAGGTGDEGWPMRSDEGKPSKGQSDEDRSGRDSEAMPLSKGFPRPQAGPKAWLPPRNPDLFSPNSGHNPQSDAYSPRPAAGSRGTHGPDTARYNIDRGMDHDQQHWMGARQVKGELYSPDARMADGSNQSGGFRHTPDGVQEGPGFRPGVLSFSGMDRPAEMHGTPLHANQGVVPPMGRSGHASEPSGGRPVFGRQVLNGADSSMPMPRLFVGRGSGGGGGRSRGRGGWGLGRDDLDSVETRHLEALAKARAEGDQLEIQTHQAALDEIQAKRVALAEEKLRHLEELERAKLEKKRKSEELRLAKELEVREKRIKKEMDKAELARRKMEEAARRDQDRQERDKRKEEERIVREKMKEEERVIRERRRETERSEREKQKQELRAEKEKKKEAVRREREAAKERAAKERALAKKLAKEAAELMDDEELELLEAKRAAGLRVDMSEGEGEDVIGRSLTLALFESTVTPKQFPPEDLVLKMKPPLVVAPWPDVETAQGDILVVWNFAQTFGELLGIPAFTLSELVQALHDRESFLLNELHLALLRIVLHDLDISNESSLPTVGGEGLDVPSAAEHPVRIAASVWGFDVGQWLRHLNILTWPEILRQFALAAGLGPKHRAGDRFNEPEEGAEHTDAVAMLRSGAAVAAAVRTAVGRKHRLAKAHQGNRRHSKLTPGTIKYAAFMVLCTAGEGGLTVPEIVERIQTAGLRDFSSSRSPEATIVGVLSRDSYFLKLGVSRYSVKSQHRKNPLETEKILAAAREAVAGVAAKDDVEEEEKMEEGKEEEEEDEEEEEGDDLGLEVDVQGAAGIGGEAINQLRMESGGPEAAKSGSGTVGAGRTGGAEEGESGGGYVKDNNLARTVKKQQEAEDDEWDMEGGRSWVKGLTDWEYVDLAVEQRLAALTDLIHFANDSRSVRAELERRYEAACAMRRQMWAEAQADRRRHREEVMQRAQGLICGKNPHLVSQPTTPAAPGRLSPSETPPRPLLCTVKSECSGGAAPQPDSTLDITLLSSPEQKVEGTGPETVVEGLGHPAGSSKGEVPTTTEDTAAVHQAEKLKARRDNIGHMADEIYAIRVGWLGRDRRYNRYWRFAGADSHEKGVVCGQIFFESAEDGQWKVIDSEEGLDALMGTLDVRGRREAALHASLKRHAPSLRLAMRAMYSAHRHNDDLSAAACALPGVGPASEGAIHVETNWAAAAEQKSAYKKMAEVKSALWSRVETKAGFVLRQLGGSDCKVRCQGCQESIKRKEHCHCPHCHITLARCSVSHAQYLEHVKLCETELRSGTGVPSDGPPSELPPRIQRLKADLLDIEDALPRDAFGEWAEKHRHIWLQKVKCSCSALDLLLALAELEGAVDREWISPSFDTTMEILGRSTFSASRSPPLLPWIPHTTMAVALRLLSFGESLAYREEDKPQNLVAKAEEAEVATGIVGYERPGRDWHSSEEDEERPIDEVAEPGKPRQKLGKFASLSARDGVKVLGNGSGRVSRGRGVGGRGRSSNAEMALPRLPQSLPSEDFHLPVREFPLTVTKGSSGRGRGRSKSGGVVKRRLKKVGGGEVLGASRKSGLNRKGGKRLKLKDSTAVGSRFSGGEDSEGVDGKKLKFTKGVKTLGAKVPASDEDVDAIVMKHENEVRGRRDSLADRSSAGMESDSAEHARDASDDVGGYEDDVGGSPSVGLESDEGEDAELEYYDRSRERNLAHRMDGDHFEPDTEDED